MNSTYFVYDIVLGTVENVDINDKPCIFPLCVKPSAPLYLSLLKDAVDRCPSSGQWRLFQVVAYVL